MSKIISIQPSDRLKNSETIGYRYSSIKIQQVIAIVKIPRRGEYVTLIIEGAGKFLPSQNNFYKHIKNIVVVNTFLDLYLQLSCFL